MLNFWFVNVLFLVSILHLGPILIGGEKQAGMRSINSGSVGHLIFKHRDRETWYQYGNRWSSKGLENKAGKHSPYWFTGSWAVFQFTVTHFMLSAYLYGPRLLNSHVPRFISAAAAALLACRVTMEEEGSSPSDIIYYAHYQRHVFGCCSGFGRFGKHWFTPPPPPDISG